MIKLISLPAAIETKAAEGATRRAALIETDDQLLSDIEELLSAGPTGNDETSAYAEEHEP